MDDILAWDTLEHFHNEKTPDWYWSLGIIALAIAILCIIVNNLLFAIFILLAAFAGGLHAARRPKIIHVELSPRGILVEDHLYEYKMLDSFWVEEHEHFQPAIILKSKKILMPYIVVPIDEHHHRDIQEYLFNHLPEVEHHETILHRVLESVGF